MEFLAVRDYSQNAIVLTIGSPPQSPLKYSETNYNFWFVTF